MDFLDSVELCPTEIKAIQDYHYPPEWTARSMRSKKASIYIIRNLVEVSRTGGQVGNCCYSGTIVFRKKDNSPITDNDITAILCIDRGQENHVRTRTESEVTIYWLCDSSD